MTVDINDGVLQLQKGGYARLERARGTRLAGVGGSAWITVDGESRDIVLAPGEAFVLESDAAVLVTAIGGPVRVGVHAPNEAAPRRAWILPALVDALPAAVLAPWRRTPAKAA